ncbi:L-fucose-proton symporter [Magnaporthiopsis poae ATCC 64411]|uniref:L-fucose-proton symporter n=1 Tax=Magnaporthiopsis poae (strain ATCC 64411 / 73-15) TaxID=644358 RepID=A0A0C4EEX1_MAGP6|nr:L-fucose-proton symporter [Magnaporthiopsis poae ATCC 64411]
MFTREWWSKRRLKVKDDQQSKAAELTLRQSIFPIFLVTILFFLWGFSYGLLDTLNKHFQKTLGIDRARSTGLQVAYFGAYPLASLGHAAWILRHYSYKAVFIWGLFLYGVGALLCIPAILARSFAGFCVCIFIIGNGLGSLETAANPFITVCGPPRYSEIRINISQAFNGIGTVIAPAMGSYVFFTFEDTQALANVQWVYLAIACFVFLLAGIFLMSNIPEITDADMAFQAAETHAGESDLPFRKQYRLFHAAAAQFCYTGAQVAIASLFINYVTEARPGTSNSLGAQLLSGAQAAFTVGRFAGVGFMHFVKPRLVFLAFLALVSIFLIPAIATRGDAGVAMMFIVLFFDEDLIVGGVFGGAVVPPLMGHVADIRGTPTAMVVPLAFMVAALSYAVAVNFVPWYRDTADAFTSAEIGITNAGAADEENSVKGEARVLEDKKVESAMASGI